MAQLFNQRLLKTAIDKLDVPVGEKRKKIDGIVQAWQTAFKDHDLSKAKETSLQGKFFSKFFCEILGYTMQDDGLEFWTLKQEAKTEVDGKEADGALGFYSKEKEQTRCVIELKDAQCNLDAKQCSRENKQTPVEQAFQYLYKFADCDWVIVSNFRHIRLYHKSKGQTAYEEFDILTLDDEKEFKKFYYCLCRENLIDKNAHSPMDLLIKQSGEADINITQKFYTDFKKVRKILFEHIVENNPDYDKKLLLGKTQKLLDRFIFIFFCEDTAGLLPHNTVENIYKNAKNSFSLSPYRVWEQFKGLFASIDKGNNNVNPPINAYNGGLFAQDEILDKLVIQDDVFEHIQKLSRYDFASDLNVNVLGHIFEQSLSDLEHLRNEIDGIAEDKKNSKRKKDGIFYTPEYITHYIVEETIGKYLEENPDKLETIKILDPACGSGAFLNQAHEYLRKQHQIRIEEKINSERTSKRGGRAFLQTNILKHSNLAENDRSILLNNIFGVDLNKESVEITKLALWLKTAHPNYKLQNLDENIKCGNSLIDDPNIVGEKAFKWEDEFKDIMDNGGFDVIIGNPPYVLVFDEKEKNYLEQKYTTFTINNNLYVAFIEQSLKLLKENGIMAFIVPNTYIKGQAFETLRQHLVKYDILEIIDFGNKIIFTDATVFSSIIIIQKRTPDCKYWNLYSNIGKIKGQIETSQTNFIVQDPILLKYSSEKTIDDYFYVKDVGYNYWSIGRGKVRGNSIGSRVLYEGVQEHQDDKPYIKGENISRYYIDKPFNYLRHNYKEFLNENDIFRFSVEIMEAPCKIVYRQTSSSLVGAIDVNSYHNDKTVHIILPKIEINLYAVLCIFNSKFLNYYYKCNTEESGQTFAQVKTINVKKLPFVMPDIHQQQSLAEKAEKMIELNKNLHEESQKALELIELEYKPKKISQKLENFYTLGLNPFFEELQKQGVKLSLSQKEDLIGWYKNKSELLNDIKTQIELLDSEIDQEVYKLYGLTDDEIKIVEA